MSPPASPHLILAGGGTGGHLFPMIAVAQRVAEQLPDLRITALCSTRAIDAQVLASAHIAGHPIPSIPVPAAPLVLSPTGLLRLFRGWGPSLRTARQLFAESRSAGGQVAVITTSGFVAPPIVRAARTDRVPVLVMNLDDPPGKATRWVARLATAKLDATLTRAAGDGWTVVPPIVRPDAIGPAATLEEPAALRFAQQAARRAIGLNPDQPTLIVVGGSQGASSIDGFLARFAASPEGQRALDGWQVLHQASASLGPNVEQAYSDVGISARVVPFLSDMASVWSAADLAVARAGAGCVAEVWANRVPTLFMPYPHHRDQHQKRNAEPLIAAGLAQLASDRVLPEANVRENGDLLIALLGDAAQRGAMRASGGGVGLASGVEAAASELVRWLRGAAS